MAPPLDLQGLDVCLQLGIAGLVVSSEQGARRLHHNAQGGHHAIVLPPRALKEQPVRRPGVPARYAGRLHSPHRVSCSLQIAVRSISPVKTRHAQGKDETRTVDSLPCLLHGSIG